MKCDFCMAELPEMWGFMVSQFTEPVWGVTNLAAEWGACDECRALIVAGDPRGVARRVKRLHPDMPFDALWRCYSMLLRHITGPLVRCHDQRSPLYG